MNEFDAPGAGRGKPKPDSKDATQDRSLDEAIAAAADMASELAEEVGTAEQGATSRAQRPINDLDIVNSEKSKESELDSQLADVERLAGETATQVSPAPMGQPISEKPKKAPPPVPDFMAEFTEPPASASVASAPPSEASQESPPKPAPSEWADIEAATSPEPDAEEKQFITAMQGSELAAPEIASENADTGSPIDCAKSQTATDQAPVPQNAAPPGIVGSTPKPLQRLQTAQRRFDAAAEPDISFKSHAPGIKEKIHTAAADAADRAVNALETINRPFDWISPGIKQALGWVAIASLATSIVVAVVSLIV